MLGLSDLHERMLVDFLRFALFAEIEIGAHTALVADSLERSCLATIASHALMDLSSLISSFFVQIVHHESLESLSSVCLHLIFNNFDEVRVNLVLEEPRAIASSARHALSVHLGSIALEALEGLIFRDLLLFSEDLAVNLLRDTLNLELTRLAFGLHGAVAPGLLDILDRL